MKTPLFVALCTLRLITFVGSLAALSGRTDAAAAGAFVDRPLADAQRAFTRLGRARLAHHPRRPCYWGL